jgi:hypothetical protein
MLPLPLRTCGACGSTARVRQTTRFKGLETNAHYGCENEKCDRRFIVMTKPGKRVLLIVMAWAAVVAVVAFAFNPSPGERSLLPIGILVAIFMAAFGAGAFVQLRAEKANPAR